MNRNNYLQFVFDKGLLYGGVVRQYFLEEYQSLLISLPLKNMIYENTKQNKNFNISLNELSEIYDSLDTRIMELLKHPDFNPFKEELRKRFPEQYGSQPFKFEGKTYYLYDKGREFYIDSLITGAISFKKLIEDHISANKPLKFVYKD